MTPDSERPDSDRPGFGPGSPGYGPGGQPQSPAPGGPQSPAPGGPHSPGGPQSPAPGAPPALPQAPAPPPMPSSVPESPASPAPGGYGGPVPPGGWQQPLPRSPQHGAPAQGQLAGWGARLGAYAIDGLILLVPFLIVFFVLVAGAVGITGEDGDANGAIGAVIAALLGAVVVFAVLALLYAPLLMKRDGERNGQTWGKQVLGIRAVRDNGEAWSFGSAALREVVLKGLAVGIASSIIPLIPWFLNFFWPLWDDQNRALHDMAASSHVVKA